MTNRDSLREEKLLKFRSALARKPVIAGLKGINGVELAASLGIKACFYLTGNILELRDLVKVCRKHDQMVFAHVDLISGVAKDNYGMALLADEVGVDGILTTRGFLITAARKAGLLGIQRLFMLDSEALHTGLKMQQTAQPDAVEILPALILPYIRSRLPKQLPPIIAGGLVETHEELDMVLRPPVLAVSTSRTELWDVERSKS